MRLIDLLSNARLESTGLNQNEYVPIHRAVWNRYDLHVGIAQGDLLQEVDSLESPRSMRAPLFRSIILRAPGTVDARDSTESNVKHPASGSMADAARVAETRRLCRAWLMGAMVESPIERTKSKGAWLAEAKMRWPNLSVRAFTVEWSAAIQEVGAFAWKRAGAPRKRVKN